MEILDFKKVTDDYINQYISRNEDLLFYINEGTHNQVLVKVKILNFKQQKQFLILLDAISSSENTTECFFENASHLLESVYKKSNDSNVADLNFTEKDAESFFKKANDYLEFLALICKFHRLFTQGLD